MKPLKRTVSKHKSLGSKSQNNNLSRSKSEIETSSKELSELEKEMFLTKINDLETRLQRKQELCNFMEEEKQFLEAEYENKNIQKRESMKILNQAYQDFHLEYLLLESELHGMENITSKARSLKKEENIHAMERTEKLSKVEEKLKRNLQEVEENVKDIPNLSKELHELQHEIVEKDANFKAQFSNLNNDFADFMKKLQTELEMVIERVIGDNGLKLHLLPVPYQALFESGMLGCTWFKSVLDICDSLLQQNKEMVQSKAEIKANSERVRKTSQKAFQTIVLTSQAKELFVALDEDYNSKKEKEICLEDALKRLESEMKYLIRLNDMNLQLEKYITELSNKSLKLEESIKEQENIDDKQEEKSHLLDIIMQAKEIIVKEL